MEFRPPVMQFPVPLEPAVFVPEYTFCVEQCAIPLPNFIMQWVGNYPDNDGQLQSHTYFVSHVQVVSL